LIPCSAIIGRRIFAQRETFRGNDEPFGCTNFFPRHLDGLVAIDAGTRAALDCGRGETRAVTPVEAAAGSAAKADVGLAVGNAALAGAPTTSEPARPNEVATTTPRASFFIGNPKVGDGGLSRTLPGFKLALQPKILLFLRTLWITTSLFGLIRTNDPTLWEASHTNCHLVHTAAPVQQSPRPSNSRGNTGTIEQKQVDPHP
jgi:hypothetical protein